ncbi:hypothetical protein AB1N83_012369 [Pleurotus pulmonarius]
MRRNVLKTSTTVGFHDLSRTLKFNRLASPHSGRHDSLLPNQPIVNESRRREARIMRQSIAEANCERIGETLFGCLTCWEFGCKRDCTRRVLLIDYTACTLASIKPNWIQTSNLIAVMVVIERKSNGRSRLCRRLRARKCIALSIYYLP